MVNILPASKVLGIDPSKTATGLCVLGSSGVHYAEVIPQSPNYETSTTAGTLREGMYQARIVVKLIEKHKPELVAIEGYAYGNQKTLAVLVCIQTCIRIAIWRMGLPYIEVAPTSLKKFTNYGKAQKKEDMKLASFKRWGFEHESNDVVDAHALAQVAWAMGRNDLKLTVRQSEVISIVGLTYPPT